MSNDDLHQRIHALPCWSSPIFIEPLSGGMTNLNFKVRDQRGEFVVRFGEDVPAHLISRSNEIHTGKAAEALGFSPRVVHHEPGVMVTEFIAGEVLNEDRVRQSDMLPRVLTLIKRFHLEMPQRFTGVPVLFWVFQVIRHYGNVLGEHGSDYGSELPSLMEISRQLEHVVGPVDLVFGHNDLLPGNFIDDGDRIWLIDFDYAGFNSPLFDLANLGANNQLTEEQERWMLDFYFAGGEIGTPGDIGSENLWRRYQAMKCASLLREVMWSMVSESISSIDFDYRSYTLENQRRFKKVYAQFASDYASHSET